MAILVAILVAMSHIPVEMQWVRGEGGESLEWWLAARKKKNKNKAVAQHGMFNNQVGTNKSYVYYTAVSTLY